VKASQPGVTDYEVIAECESAMIKAGAEPGSQLLYNAKKWPGRVGVSAWRELSSLAKGDILLMEISPCYGGYYAHLARPISPGEPSDDFRKNLKNHQKCI